MYFKNFPKVTYEIERAGYKKPAKKVALVDITTNIRLKKELLDLVTVYDYYTVEDGDTLEIISEKLYDSPNYNWLLMLLNDVYDYREDFLMDQETFDRYIARKYRDSYLNTEPYLNHPEMTYSDTTVQYVCSNCGYATVDGRIPYEGLCPDCGLKPPQNYWISRFKCSYCGWETIDGTIPTDGWCPKCHRRPPDMEWIGVHPVTEVKEYLNYVCSYCGRTLDYPPENGVCPECFLAPPDMTWQMIEVYVGAAENYVCSYCGYTTDTLPVNLVCPFCGLAPPAMEWLAQEGESGSVGETGDHTHVYIKDADVITTLDLIKWKSKPGDRLVLVDIDHVEEDEEEGDLGSEETREGILYAFNGTEWILFAYPEDEEVHNVFNSVDHMNTVITPEKRIVGDRYRVKDAPYVKDNLYEWNGATWIKVYTEEELDKKVVEHATSHIVHYVDANGYITTNYNENGTRNSAVSPVYAYDHEMKLNEDKRQIKVVSKQMLAMLLKNFKDIL